MTDHEYLELAAKANNHPWKWVTCSAYDYPVPGMLLHDSANEVDYWPGWNPLEDDGDALRLAVKCLPFYTLRYTREDWEKSGEDGYAATRRAIVVAAAEIARTMP